MKLTQHLFFAMNPRQFSHLPGFFQFFWFFWLSADWLILCPTAYFCFFNYWTLPGGCFVEGHQVSILAPLPWIWIILMVEEVSNFLYSWPVSTCLCLIGTVSLLNFFGSSPLASTIHTLPWHSKMIILLWLIWVGVHSIKYYAQPVDKV